MMRARGLRWAATVLTAALIGLTGCVPDAPSAGTDPTSSASAAPAGGERTPVSEADLKRAKEDAGIADCPVSDPDVAAREDGLPDITLECLGGGRSVRLAGLRGKPLVINVWAQWCRPCRLEAPHLATLSQQAGDKVEFIGIDYQDPDPEAAIMFAQIADWHYPQLQDPQRQIRADLQIIGVPTTILVDADGKIAYTMPQPITSEDQLRDAIHDHLGVSI
jgi:cytochrome c biogenesis protein CcmG/thiol:disulfide interchange protein DsbE